MYYFHEFFTSVHVCVHCPINLHHHHEIDLHECVLKRRENSVNLISSEEAIKNMFFGLYLEKINFDQKYLPPPPPKKKKKNSALVVPLSSWLLGSPGK